MTKKDYIVIAKVINEELKQWDKGLTPQVISSINNIALALSNVMADDNPRFNRDKFFDACGF